MTKSANAKSPPAGGNAVATASRAGTLRRAAPLFAVVAALSLGGYWAWTQQIERIGAEPHYQIGLDAVRLTPAPEWITTDVKAEALRDASLDLPLSSLDPKLAERAAQAFAFHPWIAEVKQVRKLTGALEVDVVYRRPVCMVELPAVDGQRGLYAVDVDGNLLPSRDFLGEPKRATRYPRLGGFVPGVPGRVGARWPDPRILGGAKTAAALFDVWHQLMLAKITLPEYENVAPGPPQFDLLTAGGSRIFWGHAPGSELPPEMTVDRKIAALVHYLADHGTLEGRDGPQRIDVRGATMTVVAQADGDAKPQATVAKPKADEIKK
jgi:hypothetical protein